MTSADHTVSWLDEQSTSARLRETQRALANSQADLTAMQRQRDEARAMSEDCWQRFDDLRYERDDALQERDLARAELAEVKAAAERNVERLTYARAELASARQELALLRATQVPHSHTDVPHTQETS